MQFLHSFFKILQFQRNVEVCLGGINKLWSCRIASVKFTHPRFHYYPSLFSNLFLAEGFVLFDLKVEIIIENCDGTRVDHLVLSASMFCRAECVLSASLSWYKLWSCELRPIILKNRYSQKPIGLPIVLISCKWLFISVISANKETRKRWLASLMSQWRKIVLLLMWSGQISVSFALSFSRVSQAPRNETRKPCFRLNY